MPSRRGKREINQGSAAASGVAKKPRGIPQGVASGDMPPDQAMAEKLEAQDWYQPLKDMMSAILVEKGSPTEALNALVPDKVEWKQFIREHFPPLHSSRCLVNYLEDFSSPGIFCFELWQANWEAGAGLAGHVLHEKFLNLTQLIMCNGFLSNPSEGMQLVLIKPANTELVLPLESESMGVGAIGFIKGWRRCLAASFLVACLRSQGLVEKYKDIATEKSVESFCAIYGKLMDIDGHQAIELHRGWFLKQKGLAARALGLRSNLLRGQLSRDSNILLSHR